MKQLLLLMVLALGMCSINVNAQTKRPVRKATSQTKTIASVSDESISKEKRIGIDGFVWFLVKKGKQYGAYRPETQTHSDELLVHA